MWNVAHQDNLEYLDSLPDEGTDLVFTSPPYELGKSYEVPEELKAKALTHGPLGGKHDPRGKVKTNAEYLEMLLPAMKEIVRILRPGGSLGWQTGYRYNPEKKRNACSWPVDLTTVPAFLDLGMEFYQRIIWVNTRAYPGQFRLTRRHEVISWLVKPGGPVTTNIKDVPDLALRWDGQRYTKPSDVWEVPSVRGGERNRKAHDALMPLFLAKRFIQLTTNPNDEVVDPWMGTATTIVAAAVLGRAGYGCDKEERFTMTALNDLSAADAEYTAYDPVCGECAGTGVIEGAGGRQMLCSCQMDPEDED